MDPHSTGPPRQGSLVLSYDLHRSLGVLLLPVWIVLAFTSVYLSFPNLVRSLTALVSPISAAAIPPPRSDNDGDPRITPDAAVARALAAVPEARAFGFTRDFANHRYSVRLVLPDDINPAGNSQAYIDFSTGEVIDIRLRQTRRPACGFSTGNSRCIRARLSAQPGKV